ncbi:MAG: J domain-containing protein, partial [Candidatus Berkelbacteria bacterium]|nr:J domain-containing protein [Candidatus Berkelbacteria bacterium]
MQEWEDYYQILGVNPEASDEEIKRAYRDKCFIFHPDRLMGAPESAQRQAEEELKKINRAFGALNYPHKRKEYHSEWLKKVGKTTGSGGTYAVPKPKPAVEPSFIRFDKVEPGETKRASFVIQNIGG